MFPKIGYSTNQKKIHFFDKDFNSEVKSLEILKKIRKVFTNEFIIVIDGWNSNNLQPIINTIKKEKPAKLVFFIHDIFRIYTPDFEENIDKTILIETDSKRVKSCELDTVHQITKETDLPFEVYHCEFGCKVFENNYDFEIKYFDLFLAEWIYNMQNSVNNYNIQKKWQNRFTCFSARFEPHKYLISTYLISLNNSLCSQLQKIGNKSLKHKLDFNNLNVDKNRLEIIYKTNILNKNKHHRCNTNFKPYFIDTDYDYKNVPASDQTKNVVNISQGFIHVITESRFTSPMANISEKTIKPIIAKRPFILASTPYSLALLKDMGFKTFSEFWDESYDEVTDHSERINLILDLIDYLNSIPLKNLKKMNKRMKRILEFNYRKFYQISIKNNKGHPILC